MFKSMGLLEVDNPEKRTLSKIVCEQVIAKVKDS